MHEVAPGVWQLHGIVPHVINTYLIRTGTGEALIDTGTPWSAGRVLRQLRNRPISLVALTHVHPDHQGSAAEICTRLRVPLACHEADAGVMEGRAPMAPRIWFLPPAFDRILSGPPHPVALRWRGGEMLGEFRVLHAPGHTPGHVIYFREADGVAIAGDVVRNVCWPGGARAMEPPGIFTVDMAQNRQSMRLLASLRPRLVLCGHGPPLHDMAALDRCVARLR
jgi:glyoxylase-like metal-dependent hydrolase (beta-lactamase superfamily II)